MKAATTDRRAQTCSLARRRHSIQKGCLRRKAVREAFVTGASRTHFRRHANLDAQVRCFVNGARLVDIKHRRASGVTNCRAALHQGAARIRYRHVTIRITCARSIVKFASCRRCTFHTRFYGCGVRVTEGAEISPASGGRNRGTHAMNRSAIRDGCTALTGLREHCIATRINRCLMLRSAPATSRFGQLRKAIREYLDCPDAPSRVLVTNGCAIGGYEALSRWIRALFSVIAERRAIEAHAFRGRVATDA